MGETVSRLLPLVQMIARTRAGMTLFTDLTLPILPAALEVSPLITFKDSLNWPDFMALDVPLERLPELRSSSPLRRRDITQPGTGAGHNSHPMCRNGTMWGMCSARQEGVETGMRGWASV